jgi:microcompartment protein CcmL/EutN
MKEPAIGIIELNSLALGTVVSDAMAKRAPVEVLESHPICPGKFLVVVVGEVDDVKEAMEAGRHYASYTMTDSTIIENLDDQVLPAMNGANQVPEISAVGLIETWVCPSVVIAADAACKAARIRLIEIRLANGLGGKGYMTLTGELHEVEAAIDAAVNAITSGHLIRREIIPAPHNSVKPTLF